MAVAVSGASSGMEVRIQDEWAVASSPEGLSARMKVNELVGRIAPGRMNTCGVVLPDGVKLLESRGRATIWVHQTPPQVHSLKWIAADSPAQYGNGTRYREVRIALPYVVVLATFVRGRDGQMHLGRANECFFRSAPLVSFDDTLCFPALLNCSRFDPPDGQPLSWICTQHLNCSAFADEADPGKRLRLEFDALMHCLLETGFNYSSEHHEESSWFTASRTADPRIASIEKWQEATEASWSFVLEVPWLEVGLSVRQVMQRTFDNLDGAAEQVRSACDIARQMFNRGKNRVDDE